METCKEYTADTAVLGAALLHDVLEDTDVTAEYLDGFLRRVLDGGSAGACLRYTV